MTGQPRLILIKLISLLALVRWYNILLVALAQYLSALFIFHHIGQWKVTLLDPELHLVTFSSAFIIAAGYIINGFYDFEKDLVNRPKQAIFDQMVSKWFRLNCFFLFNFIGMLLAYFVNYKILIFNAIFAGVIWFYSHKLKKYPLIGNLSAAFLAIVPFFTICIYYDFVNYLILNYVVFIFVIEWTREVIKDLMGIKGDVIYGYRTLPVVAGVKKTKVALYFLMLSTIFPILILYYFLGVHRLLLYFVSSYILVLFSAVFLARANTVDEFQRINRMYKVIILMGIASIVLI